MPSDIDGQPLTMRQVWLGYHVREVDKARRALHLNENPAEQVALLNSIESHRAAICALDRECQNEDRTNFPASGKWSEQQF